MTTGSGSSFQITRLAAKYNEALKNGQLLSNRHAVEIIDDRIVQLAQRIDIDEAPGRIGRLYELWETYKYANEVDQIKAKVALDAEFTKVYHDYMAWGQIFEALDLRRKMVESEVKILKEIRGVISAEDAYELVAKLLAAVIRVLGNAPKQLKQVQYEFARIIGETSDNAAERLIDEIGGDRGETGGES